MKRIDVIFVDGNACRLTLEDEVKTNCGETVVVRENYETAWNEKEPAGSVKMIILAVDNFNEYRKRCIEEWQPTKRPFEDTAQLYAEFCVRCDRAGLPLVNFKDWNKEIDFK